VFSGRDAKKTQLISSIENELKNVRGQFEQERHKHELIKKNVTNEISELKKEIEKKF
jgi:hypothetical protein